MEETTSTWLMDLKIPRHIAIIMDGNGRWAQKKGAARIYGHRNAITAVRESTEYCAEKGVDYLTLYAFSTENWGRPKFEVEGLMSLLVKTINNELSTLMDNNVSLASIGDTSMLPSQTREKLHQAIEVTSENDGLRLVLALNYSGRWDLENAMKLIAEEVEAGKLSSKDISTEIINSKLSTAGMIEPELIIRTSGEQRISNFYLWQAAYSEFYFTNVLWPDFRKQHMEEALTEYSHRERRFGKTAEQLVSK